MKKGVILCVDDEPSVLIALRDQLKKHYPAYLVEIAESAAEGLDILDEIAAEGWIPLVVISDFIMPSMNGDAFLSAARKLFPHIITVLLSGQGNEASIHSALATGSANHFFSKPWEATDLMRCIDAGLDEFWRKMGNDHAD
ncbi:response regulator [Chromobacterium alticapitis]|uniref:Response regulatory domain-containing protein n=1 Tax=Chromobacterium alticapitis TaxID=2073169 RepID=A0A2S5DEE2_9NEIS|nr:response regulator [Chromobacterium alticapitis]POZ61473.1 hypothetical protein C2I19_13265 [Chromobacterium alticapitis]